jgi:hypothetical protein
MEYHTGHNKGKLVTSLDPGCYTVSVVDTKGCSVSDTYCLPAPTQNINIALHRQRQLGVSETQPAP